MAQTLTRKQAIRKFKSNLNAIGHNVDAARQYFDDITYSFALQDKAMITAGIRLMVIADRSLERIDSAAGVEGVKKLARTGWGARSLERKYKKVSAKVEELGLYAQELKITLRSSSIDVGSMLRKEQSKK